MAAGWVKTPAGALPCSAEVLFWMGWGALSLPLQISQLVSGRRGKGRCGDGGPRDWGLYTYKKNLGSPLTAACRSAYLSVGFLGMGLQKAKGSQQASVEVRYKWWAVIVADIQTR